MASTAGLRERKKAKTREALEAAALTLFTERGFEHTTVEDIAAACDVSPRTFFRYFPTKDDVLFGDAEERRARMLAVLADQPPTSTPLGAVRVAVISMANEYERERDQLVARMAIVNATPSLRIDKAERHRDFEDSLFDALEARTTAAQATPLELRLVAATAMAALRAAIDTWLAGRRTADLTPIVTDAFDRLATGLDR